MHKILKGTDISEFMEQKIICTKCSDKRRIMKANGEISPCFDCLIAGRMDQHDKNPKDSGITI